MYDKTDPRAKLANQTTSSVSTPTEFATADYVKFYDHVPHHTNLGTKTWWSRGQNFVLSYSEAMTDEEFVRSEQPDEYVVLLPDKSSRITISAADGITKIDGFSVVIVPPGASKIQVNKGGRVIQLFTSKNKDLAALSINQESYKERHPNVASFEPWAKSPSGLKVRSYGLDVPAQDGRFGRIWRCSTFMVNFLDPNDGPRNPSKLSPHAHDNFEQCSLVLQGEYVHHLRYPWTIDSRKWQPDEHELCRTPSMTVIPPYAIHTSQAVNDGINQLVDIFCPPRIDFSRQEGWVLNASDYPLDNG